MNIAVTAPTAATAAPSRNASRKPALLGEPPATMLPARSAPLTCEPSDEPTERTSALKPVASPVSVGLTASTIRFGIAENARPMPANRTAEKSRTSNRVSCTRPSSVRPTDAVAHPRPSGTRPP